MGISILRMGLSDCSCEQKCNYKVVSASHWDCGCGGKASKLPNPDPKNFKILRSVKAGRYVTVMVNYPDCTNYEGNKVLVFSDLTQDQIGLLKSIDPHFCEGDHPSPIARFEPTADGWDMSITFINTLNNKEQE